MSLAKNLFLVLLLLGVVGIALFPFQDFISKHAPSEAEDVPPSVNPQNISSPMSNEKTLNIEMSHWKSTLSSASVQSQCLKDSDICGQRKQYESSFFDPNETPAHRILLKHIQNLHDLAQRSSIIKKQINETSTQKLLLRFLSVENQSIQLATLSLLLLNEKPSDLLLNDILSLGKHFKDSTRTILLKTISHFDMSKGNKKIYIDLIQHTFKNNEVNTSLEMARSLNALGLSVEERKRLIPELCWLRNAPASKHNWPAFRLALPDLQLLCET